jgi:CO dehydrogenase maturation factor
MGSLPGGVSKHAYLDYEIRHSLSEGDRFDLIAMGRSEGPGCYCAVNHNLREVVDSISKNYRYVVIDNEAGMEHLSRRTTRGVQHLLVVSDPSYRGLVAAQRIAGFRHELDIDIEHAGLILNRLSGDVPAPLQEHINQMDIPFLGTLPQDEKMAAFEAEGRPLIELDGESPVYRAVARIMADLLK